MELLAEDIIRNTCALECYRAIIVLPGISDEVPGPLLFLA